MDQVSIDMTLGGVLIAAMRTADYGFGGVVLQAHRSWWEGIEHHLRRGIFYPAGTHLAIYNVPANASGLDRMRGVARLYEHLFSVTVIEHPPRALEARVGEPSK